MTHAAIPQYSGAAAPLQLKWVLAEKGKAANRGRPSTDLDDLACRHGPEAFASPEGGMIVVNSGP
jgi:hypothetical protein